MIDKTKKPLFRIGNGFDVHKFSKDDGENFLTLGTIKIPYKHSIIAHSDGDVVLHSLTDAMLGSIGEGDIGDIFPDTDLKFKNADSKIFLNYALSKIHENGYSVNNVDLTIICESPKLFKYKKQMSQNIANELQISHNMVNVKATTTEGLGFLGRGEGIACQSSICIALKY